MNDISEKVVSVLHGLLKSPTSLHEPSFKGREWDYIKDCIDTGWVSTAGAYVERFEEMLREFTGAKHVIATSSGTAALHSVFAALNIGHGDEVIVQSLTFIATANAITYTGARPHFADIEELSLGLDVKKIREHLEQFAEKRKDGLYNLSTGGRIVAVACMHTFGHPSNLDALAELCKDFDLILIEDAAESLGSYYKGRHTGNHGHVATLSFNGNKTITTGGGGAILTNDSALAAKLRHLTTTAKTPHSWEFIHDCVGFNYRLPNINAALGCAQLEELPNFLLKKRQLADAYKTAFSKLPEIKVFNEPAWGHSNYWLNLLLLNKANFKTRDKILTETNNAGYMTRPAWRPMHKLPMFSNMPCTDLSKTEDIYARLVNIPSSPHLADQLTDA